MARVDGLPEGKRLAVEGLRLGGVTPHQEGRQVDAGGGQPAQVPVVAVLRESARLPQAPPRVMLAGLCHATVGDGARPRLESRAAASIPRFHPPSHRQPVRDAPTYTRPHRTTVRPDARSVPRASAAEGEEDPTAPPEAHPPTPGGPVAPKSLPRRQGYGGAPAPSARATKETRAHAESRACASHLASHEQKPPSGSRSHSARKSALTSSHPSHRDM